MSAEKKGKIINEVKNIQKDLISSIRDLVSIYSAESTPSENAPFGDGPLEALRKVLNIAEKMGFHTENIDNKIGYAQYGESENDEYIGIFGHVDVVPL